MIDEKDLSNPSDDLQRKISAHILKSGYPLELNVRDQIRSASSKLANVPDIDISHHTTYIDPDDDKVREIDISWFIPSWHDISDGPSLFYSHFFECKSSEKQSWIFFTEPISEDLSKNSYSSNLENLAILPDLAYKSTEVLGAPIFYGHANKLAHSYLTYPESSPDVIRTAVFQAVKPAFLECQTFLDELLDSGDEDIISASLFFPVVVYSGYLFEYEHNSKTGTNVLRPANHIVLQFEHSIKRKRLIFLVDVVRADCLPDYLDRQVTDMMNIHNYMQKVKPTRKSIKISKIL